MRVRRNHAIPLQPADWKLQKGVLPVPISSPSPSAGHPALTGVRCTYSVAGPDVTRSKPSDRVISYTAAILLLRRYPLLHIPQIRAVGEEESKKLLYWVWLERGIGRGSAAAGEDGGVSWGTGSGGGELG